jgi:hypothetical protein
MSPETVELLLSPLHRGTLELGANSAIFLRTALEQDRFCLL